MQIKLPARKNAASILLVSAKFANFIGKGHEVVRTLQQRLHARQPVQKQRDTGPFNAHYMLCSSCKHIFNAFDSTLCRCSRHFPDVRVNRPQLHATLQLEGAKVPMFIFRGVESIFGKAFATAPGRYRVILVERHVGLKDCW